MHLGTQAHLKSLRDAFDVELALTLRAQESFGAEMQALTVRNDVCMCVAMSPGHIQPCSSVTQLSIAGRCNEASCFHGLHLGCCHVFWHACCRSRLDGTESQSDLLWQPVDRLGCRQGSPVALELMREALRAGRSESPDVRLPQQNCATGRDGRTCTIQVLRRRRRG